jgi:serine-type D-Ala-D-Ala carboxypeptidase
MIRNRDRRDARRARLEASLLALVAAGSFVFLIAALVELRRPPLVELPTAVAVAPVVTPPTSVESVVAAGVGEAYPGAVLATGRGAAAERLVAFGRIGWRAASPVVTADGTIYDLASLTKAMATTTAVLLLVQDGVIELDEPVRRHLPQFEGRWKDDVTWRHLLTHTSGLPVGAAIRGSTPPERLRRVLRTRLQTPPGQAMAYSDIGFIALWAAAEQAAGEPLPELLERRVWAPLGMTTTRFAPGRDCDECAPTLRLRTGEVFRGVSSDPIARQLGAVAGHAGLFATAPDVGRFAAMIAGGGELDGVRILEPQLVAELFRQQPGAGRRTLGWTAYCPDEPPRASVPCEKPLAYGHTGWTGTSLWIDAADRHWAVLLTNRSYERSERPFPLEALRRDIFLLVTGHEHVLEPTRWLASGAPAEAPVHLGEAPALAAPRPAVTAR